jgi:hypothetical protein
MEGAMHRFTRFIRLGLGGALRSDDRLPAPSMSDLLRRLRRRARARSFY